jgi:Na+-driven multidrug efflux pump
MMVAGITQGMQPIAGYNQGLGQFCRVRRVLLHAMILATAVTSLGTLLMQVFPYEIVSMFVKESDGQNAHDARIIIDNAKYGITVVSLIFPFVGSQIVISNFFQAIGRPVMSIFLTLTRQLIFLFPCLLIMPGMFGLTGIWYSQVVADVLAVLMGFTVITLFLHKVFPKKDVCLQTR